MKRSKKRIEKQIRGVARVRFAFANRKVDVIYLLTLATREEKGLVWHGNLTCQTDSVR